MTWIFSLLCVSFRFHFSTFFSTWAVQKLQSRALCQKVFHHLLQHLAIGIDSHCKSFHKLFTSMKFPCFLGVPRWEWKFASCFSRFPCAQRLIVLVKDTRGTFFGAWWSGFFTQLSIEINQQRTMKCMKLLQQRPEKGFGAWNQIQFVSAAPSYVHVHNLQFNAMLFPRYFLRP